MDKRTPVNKTRALALCSVFSALGVIIIYMGALVEILDLSMAVVASLLVIVAVIELGGVYPWLVYAVTSALSLLLLPNKFAAIVYFAFAGFYPILKASIERVKGLVCLVIKLVVFDFCLLAMFGVAKALALALVFEFSIWIIAILLNVTFVFYDFALTRLITAYVYVWRKKLKIDKWKL